MPPTFLVKTTPAMVRAKAILDSMRADPLAPAHYRDLAAAVGAGCRVNDCYLPHRALGYCDTHYRAARRLRDMEAHRINAAARA